jgi:hypothetical protein
VKTPETKLERHVARWLKTTGRDYDTKAQGAYDDLLQGGCQSGMVGHLIYYSATVPFYKRYASEIDALLAALCQDTGESPAQLFGDKWDADDPLARDTLNQNLLAWFGFEEAARRLMEE